MSEPDTGTDRYRLGGNSAQDGVDRIIARWHAGDIGPDVAARDRETDTSCGAR